MATKNKIEFMQGAEFPESLGALFQKGGKYQKAAERVYQAWGKANAGETSFDAVFGGLSLTNNGEDRIAHCRKFDLTGFARLVTAYSNNLCIFLFAGDHDAAEHWLNANKGLDFIAREQGSRLEVAPVYVSNRAEGKDGLIKSETDWMSTGPVIEQLPERYRERLLNGLHDDVVAHVRGVKSHTSEDVVLDVIATIEDATQADAVLDVLLKLRSSDLVGAKARVDLYANQARTVDTLSADEVSKITSGDKTVRVQDVDPVLFEHFVKTADFRQWMLYLHPQQREFVDRDFAGPTRLAGVSGSGKTCVVIHRALRLARGATDKRVLVLTLNEALAKLINELIDAESGSARPSNLMVKSVFDLCREKLIGLEPQKRDYYGKRIVQRNAFAVAEHIDDIWEEYFLCQANNNDADAMFDVARTLLARNVLPQDYLRQELDYVRSAFAPGDRSAYLEMQRDGRVVALERRYREMVLEGLAGWERKMAAVGAIDDVGIVTALCAKLDALTPEFDHVLVDEVQDLGTLELRIIRRLTRPGANDLFLCGDAAQTVHTKYLNVRDAEIDLPSARWIRLNQNYRNSRQILTAAYEILTRSFNIIPRGTIDVEILQPEFANFTSAKPLLLNAASIQEELAMALTYGHENIKDAPNHKVCIALCGYSQAAVERLAASLTLPALCGTTDLTAQPLFLSDLEQTKGFEFDLMIVLNCGRQVIPHPELPEHESFRELFKLYVALTRAKTELVVSFHGGASRFVEVAKEFFNEANWREHVDQATDVAGVVWPSPTLRQTGNVAGWEVTGREFLRMRDAVGLSQVVQDEILQHVTGTAKTEAGSGGRRKQTEWREFRTFYRDLESPIARNGIISSEAWSELIARLAPLIQQNGEDTSAGVAAYDSQRSRPAASSADVEDRVAQTRTATLKLYRHSDILKFSQQQLSAHILASFTVAQGVTHVSQLEVGKPMHFPILGFLVPRQELAEWLKRQHIRQLRTDPDVMVLTKAGLDECHRRVVSSKSILVAANHVLKEDVATSQQAILEGRTMGSAAEKFYERSFEVKATPNGAST
ncbi:UvrD-helicase domain-containing protein [Burkholderia contaminans]|uniref:UvrD-helicase domain-containing protein n=1 Tax=Burkholderia contaminans TaxID=488447 RepID=UPI001CF2540C|nr:UvrD-helicase domain-containing protein [Burkholderia contaminans]MCA7920796.1 UvrD-helicase domain-containing protein [Burkholderia contaminans]UUX37264.1 UvrD-helicase domain-containing protein [Burkholderia contaminans]